MVFTVSVVERDPSHFYYVAGLAWKTEENKPQNSLSVKTQGFGNVTKQGILFAQVVNSLIIYDKDTGYCNICHEI